MLLVSFTQIIQCKSISTVCSKEKKNHGKTKKKQHPVKLNKPQSKQVALIEEKVLVNYFYRLKFSVKIFVDKFWQHQICGYNLAAVPPE